MTGGPSPAEVTSSAVLATFDPLSHPARRRRRRRRRIPALRGRASRGFHPDMATDVRRIDPSGARTDSRRRAAVSFIHKTARPPKPPARTVPPAGCIPRRSRFSLRSAIISDSLGDPSVTTSGSSVRALDEGPARVFIALFGRE